jgi:hypothetical protein
MLQNKIKELKFVPTLYVFLQHFDNLTAGYTCFFQEFYIYGLCHIILLTVFNIL